MNNTPEYLEFLEEKFIAASNENEAIAMKKYMKNKFEFFGIKSPIRKEIYKIQKEKNGLLPDENFDEIVRWCWTQPQREYQYFAMEFMKRRMKKIDVQIIDLYEFILLEKSWWDTVDFIAANLLGDYFKKYPDQIIPITNRWMKSGNMWLQRSCLLFQLKYKNLTDINLLTNFILELNCSKEFFINKAIGWVLREYSKTKPAFVVEFVKVNSLSNLSQREALKWMRSRGLV